MRAQERPTAIRCSRCGGLLPIIRWQELRGGAAVPTVKAHDCIVGTVPPPTGVM